MPERALTITVEFGGKKLIRVEDDGRGWSRRSAAGHRAPCDEQDPASRRPARIATLGFRGEALPAIASVSHFVLRTRARGAAPAPRFASTAAPSRRWSKRACRKAPRSKSPMSSTTCRPAQVPEVRRRRVAQVSRIVTQLALCYPEVGFTLTSAGRKVLPSAGLVARDRLYQLYGDRTDLVGVRRDGGGVTCIGYIAALAEQDRRAGRSTSSSTGASSRIRRSRTPFDAYSVASNKERSPEVHLFLEMPPDAVDVNVHPTKAEVRFREQSFIHELVRRALGDALGRGPAPELQSSRRSGGRSQHAAARTLAGFPAAGRSAQYTKPRSMSHRQAEPSSHRRA